MTSDRACILAAALLLAACDSAPKEQTLCAVTRTPVPADEVTRFGFSGEQLLAIAEGSHTAQLTWDTFGLDPSVVTTNVTPGQTTVSVSVARTGSVYVVHQEPQTPDAPCSDGVEADVEVEVVSADGALAETERGTVFSSIAAAAHLSVELPHPPMGTLRIDAAPSSGLHYSSLGFSLDFELGELWGGLILILGDGTGALDSWTVFFPARLSPLTTAAAPH